MRKLVSWFELPATNVERAAKFYSIILNQGFEITEHSEAFFRETDQTRAGAISPASDDYTPSDKGVVIYLDVGSNLTEVLTKVEAAGGKVLGDKISIGEEGYVAHILDTEGNKVGLYSPD